MEQVYWNSKLINFNVPTELLKRFDYLNRQQSTTRTSTLLSLMDGWVRSAEQRHTENIRSKIYQNENAVGFWSVAEEYDDEFI
jgi:hypothetical protein